MNGANTYLTFNGNCRDAMKFYSDCLGAELQLMPFGETPGPDGKPFAQEFRDRIMHARLSKGKVTLMASDNMPGMPFQAGNNFSIALDCESGDEVDQLFNALSQKGKVTMPPQETFWAGRFGMTTDQFGINWMFSFANPNQQ